MLEAGDKETASKVDLERLLKRANVPTLPVIAQKLVELCKDDRADFSDFARVIESDPGLASRILRMTNSAFYGLRTKVTTLERAISTLGLKHVKSISLGFHLATALSNTQSPEGFDMGKFWQQSVLRGVFSRELADAHCPARREEAFLVGLLQDCGVPFLAQALGEPYARLWHDNQNSPSALYRLEQKLFEVNHVTAAKIITEKWALPTVLAEPVHEHHHKNQKSVGGDDQLRLCQVAYFAGTISWNNPESLSDEDMSLLDYSRRVFNIDKAGLKKCLQRTQEEFGQISTLFADILADQTDVADLLCQAKDMLSDLEEDSKRELFDLESEVKRLQDHCEVLTKSVEETQQVAQTDELTGLAKRSYLEQYVETACAEVQNGEATLMMLFIDVDNFKHFNDNYSHAVGDRVLKATADLLKSIFPEKSCQARYGGDEFVVALLGLSLKQSIQLGRALVARIAEMEIPTRKDDAQGTLKITCSVGMVFCESGSHPGNAARVQELADHQMYQAKQGGKNDLCYQVLTGAQADAPVPDPSPTAL